MSIKAEKKQLTLYCRPDMYNDRRAELSVPDPYDSWDGGPEGLVRLCAALSFAAGDPELLTADLKALGFGGLSLRLRDDDPYSAGLAFACRKQGGQALAAIVLSGTQGAQWYSNFRVGFTQEHRGFAIAADRVERLLGEYLRAHAGGEVRFLITGYSRGGAVANILSRRLCDRWGTDAVRCVTFASPNTGLPCRRASYDVILNIVRGEDFFTRVPPAQWGYIRSGRTVVLSGDIRDEYRRLTGEDYIGFTEPSPVDAVIRAMTRLAPNVNAYYKRLYPVGGRMMSLYDYMMSAASMLADDADESAGEIMLDSAVSRFADLSAFLSAGMDISALLSPAAGIPRCSAGDSHSPAAYLAGITVNGEW